MQNLNFGGIYVRKKTQKRRFFKPTF